MVECSHNTKIGGPNWGKNKCPDCGKVENRYYLGSSNWEPQKCMECLTQKIESLLEVLNEIDVLRGDYNFDLIKDYVDINRTLLE